MRLKAGQPEFTLATVLVDGVRRDDCLEASEEESWADVINGFDSVTHGLKVQRVTGQVQILMDGQRRQART